MVDDSWLNNGYIGCSLRWHQVTMDFRENNTLSMRKSQPEERIVATMESQYHIQLLTETVGNFFSPRALEEIIRANLGQDALRYQLGGYPHYHFDNNQIAKGWAYVDEEHERIGQLAATKQVDAQRAAFGRLTHAAHDFYAHSNYVELWLAAHGGLANTTPDQIDALDPTLLQHPQLRTGSFLLWFDPLYYLPGLRSIIRRLYLRPGSHEAMNLDSPAQGPLFAYAMAAAKQRTLYEYQRVVNTLTTLGGDEALHHFTRG
jgi:hypothetical protein